MHQPSNAQTLQGFTLIELIVVITIVAILAATANKFIANPTQSYFDLETRANLTDRADTALRQMARQIRNALPNSVRTTTGTDSFIEFLPVKHAGRYRASKGASGDDELDISSSTDTFEIYGSAVTTTTGDQIVIYNLGEPGLDAFETNAANRKNISGSGNTLTFAGSTAFPLSSPGSRFYLVDTPVTYACDMTTDPNNKKLLMYSNYAIQALQPTNIATLDGLSSVRKSILAEQLTSCSFDYSPGVSQRSGIVNLTIAMQQDTAKVRLMHQVNVANTP